MSNVLDITEHLPKKEIPLPQDQHLVLKSGPHWLCKAGNCNSDTFHLYVGGLYCAACGEVQELPKK